MLLRTGSALVAGVLLALAFEPVGASFLIPFAVAGFVLTSRGLPVRRGWIPGLAFGIGFCYVLMFWMRVVGIDAWLALSALEASFYAILGAVSAGLSRMRLAPVWIACAWVGTEAVRSTWPFGGMPWGRLAFATAGTPWQEALPYVGQSGVSLLLALLGCLLAWAVVSTGRTRIVSAVSVVALLGLGMLPALVPYDAPMDGQRSVAVVQGNVPGDGDDILLDHRQVTRNHVDATIELADEVAAGEATEPDFVLWPENSTAVDPFADADINAQIREASDALGRPILVGAMVDAGAEHVLNQGIVWVPGVGAADRYTKRHPVPFGEYIPWRSIFRSNFGRLALIPRDMRSGTRVEPIRIADTEVADAICFDVAYDDGIHAQIRHGAELLVVQTSNAMFINTSQIDQQFEISRLRALETGRYVLVAATNGVSGIVAPDGTVLDRAAPKTQAVLTGDVGLSTAITPAVWLGPWVGRVCAGVAVAALVTLCLGLLPYRRRQARAEGMAQAKVQGSRGEEVHA